ncbi:hypothetical protein AWC38_SpisGene21443 [Stylophora pistillata]|uniref:Uncharacterized protein n=1 Tax=Stylophora pistillata TaxID=50429 RepID=A0A2B4RC87_STYPI|nr:hypothetical protein AWC38_SpisGene21443 [Stylophora pistillata]
MAANYAAAVELLKKRFGKKIAIQRTLVNELLNTQPVFNDGDTVRLRNLYDFVESKYRALQALQVEEQNYSEIVVPVLLERIPASIRLTITRGTNYLEWSVQELLAALLTEVELREDHCLNQRGFSDRRKVSVIPTANALFGRKGEVKGCAFCLGNQAPENCTKVNDIGELKQKKDILNALQSGGELMIKPTVKQRSGFLGTLLASIGVPLLLNALTGKGLRNRMASGKGGAGMQNRPYGYIPYYPPQAQQAPTVGAPGPPGPPGEGFKKTFDGNFDIENKQLKNLKEPTDPQDSCTKAYTDSHVHTDGRRPMTGALNMQDNKTINVADPTNNKDVRNDNTIDGTISFNGHLPNRDRQIINLGTPIAEDNAANEKYVDNQVATKPNTSLIVLRDGSQAMTGNFDLYNFKAINSAAPTAGTDLCNKTYIDSELAKKHDVGSDDLSNYLDRTKGRNIEKVLNFTSLHGGKRQITSISDQPLNGTAVVNSNKLNAELKKKADADVMINGLSAKLEKADADVMISGLSAKLEKTTFNTEIANKPNTSAVMLLDGSQSMIANLDLGNQKAVNSAAPSASTDFCNKTYVDGELQKTKTNLEKHINNHLSHSIITYLNNDLDYVMNGIIGNEFSDEDNITVDMYSAAKSEYTVVFEMWWESKKVDPNSVTLSATSSVEIISRLRSNRFSNHIVSLTHMTKWSNTTPNYLMFDIVMKFKRNISKYHLKLPIWVVVYGSKGYHNSLPEDVWDRWYSFYDSEMHIYPQTILTNDPQETRNPTTKKYVDDIKTSLQTKINARATKTAVTNATKRFGIEAVLLMTIVLE